jgi:hypothetical protein
MKCLIFSLLLITNIAYSKVCRTDNFFEAAMWDIQIGQDFFEVSAGVMDYFEQNKAFFVPGITKTIFSKEHNAIVTFKSFDDLRTDKLDMVSDLVIATEPKTGELMEVRWYDENLTKNIIYNDKLENCSMALLPTAENTLF